jgi:outer membrane receptor protein involved in Fe transport
MKRLVSVVLFTTVSALATGSVHAQEMAAPPEQSASQADAQSEPQGAAADSASTTAGDIVVTGTRVANGANSPTPVTVLPTEEFLKLNPGTVTEAVNLLPALQGSQNISSRPGGGQRNGAGAYFNLRNLGNLRTLVLYDGMRLIPTINQNEADVDAAIVPQLLLKRVDVVTGGVSAVYGSDAIAGVINFITDRDFTGVRLQASSSISTYGDDRIGDIGIAAGTHFGADDRGHIEVSYQYRKDQGILDRRNALDRSFYAANTGFAGSGTAANPFFNVPDMRLSNTTFGGLIVATSNAADLTALRNFAGGQLPMFLPNGQLTGFVHGLVPVAGGTFAPFGTAGITLASANVESGGSGAYFPSSSIKSALELQQAFGRVDYDLTENLHAYAQLAYSRIVTQAQFRSPNFTANNGSLRFSYANPFLQLTQEPYRSFFAANPTRTFNLNEVLLNQPRNRQTTEAWIAFAGLEGGLGGDWKWDINAGYQQSTIRAVDLYNIDRGKLAAALDVVRNANGQIVCRAAATNAAYANCVPLNIFGGIEAASPEALAYIYTPTFNRNRSRMETVAGSVSGSPFETWAGPVKVAVSGEYRRLRWDAVTNTDPTELANCAGISFNCTQGTTLRWFNNTMGPVPTVSQKVTEGALEVNVPLLRDMAFAQSFSVTGAVRRTHYSTSGNVTTWKLGADWQIVDDLRIRATRSRDIRAPNLFDLFTSTQINCGISAVDKLTGTTYNNLCNTVGSNPDLEPEFANTLTVGAVLTPSFLPGFTATIDYYKIDVDNVILLQQGFSTPVLNFCADVQGNAPVCSLVSRANWTDRNPATNPITATRSSQVNVAALHTWGVDTELGYHFDLAGRDLSLRALIAYQPTNKFDQGPSGVISFAGAYNAGSNRLSAAAKWRVTGVISYDITDNINLTVLERWRSGLKAIYDDNVSVVKAKLPSLGYTNVNLTWKPGETELGDYEFYVNVANLFNKFPTVYYTGQPALPSSQPFTPEGDDVIGRVFTVGARVKF